MKIEKLLKNRFLYYVAVMIMAINVLGYISIGSINCVLIFIVSTYFANYFTKNRTLDILIALFVSNIVFGCSKINSIYESLSINAKKAAKECKERSKKSVCELGEDCQWNKNKNECHLK